MAAVGAVEGDQRCQRSSGSHLKDRATVSVGPAVFRRAVEIAVAALHQRGKRMTAIAASEGDQHRPYAVGRHTEHRAVLTLSAVGGCAVEIPVAALHQRGRWIFRRNGHAGGAQELHDFGVGRWRTIQQMIVLTLQKLVEEGEQVGPKDLTESGRRQDLAAHRRA